MNAGNLLNLLYKQMKDRDYKSINFLIPDKLEAIKENVNLYCPFIIRPCGSQRFVYTHLELKTQEDSIIICANNKGVTKPGVFLDNLRKLIATVGNINIYCKTSNADLNIVGYGNFKIKEIVSKDSLSLLTSIVVF